MRTLVLCLFAASIWTPLSAAEFTAGAAVTDVTPKKLPVLVNGGMTSRSADQVNTPVNARSLAFSDGEETIVLVVVDSCMMPRELLDEAKSLAAKKCGVPPEHMLVSATHTHTAPSCMGALGTNADPAYVLFLTKKLVEAILAPLQDMEPARIGWGEVDAGDYTALRRWVLHPDHVQDDPFGNPTVRANMHAARNRDQVIGKSGPEDPALSLISVETAGGEPLALLANFSMHYYGDRALSADYFGLFCGEVKKRLAPGNDRFVALMSHGCSGDIWRHDYEKSPDRNDGDQTIESYAAEMADLALEARADIEHRAPESIAMEERRFALDYRVPNRQRLQWARRVLEKMGDRPPKTKPEVYAREQILLHEKRETEIVVQGLRLGDDIAIATTPNETYALTGLKVKAASPVEQTMVIELANGGDGYIPPPEQHLLGGYNTWPARTAGLEVEAEPRIAETAVQLLEDVTGERRADRRPGHGSAAAHTLSLEPRAYWRLDEMAGPRAVDASPNHLDAIYEPRVLFYLPGPHSEAFADSGVNRAAHFAGDRLRTRVPGLGDGDFSVSLWFWSGSPEGIVDDFEWILSRGHDYGDAKKAWNVGITDDTDDETRRLVFRAPGVAEVRSREPIERWSWRHLALVRAGGDVSLYLNGEPVGEPVAPQAESPLPDTIFFGGGNSNDHFFEGRLDEIAVFDRALDAEAISELHRMGTVR